MLKQVLLAAMCTTLVAIDPSYADAPAEPDGVTEVWEVSRGGQLYDKW